MKRPILAVDVDDVLANSTESLRQVVNDRYGAALESHHYKIPGEYHAYYERVWEQNGLSGLVDYATLNAQMVTDQSHVKPHDDASNTLQKLAQRYDLAIITARDVSWRPATEHWLQKNFPETFSFIYFAGGHDDPTHKTKGDVCHEIGAAWLIDDNPEHCQDALAKGTKTILFGDYGWHVTVPKDAIRCKDWNAVGKLLYGK